jgi:predicted CXXCH cytochrome family protein
MRLAFLGALALILMAAPVMAFHDGGVADCQGCHTMHNSEDGVPVDPANPGGNPWLLRSSTPSDVCLGCHATRLGAVFNNDPLFAYTERGGGNFQFLLEDNLNDGHGGATDPIPGRAGGHNLDAPGHGAATDGTVAVSPGGGFPAAVMGCTSCHDPHGTDSFRLLYGAGRSVQDGVAIFLNAAPTAEGININGGAEGPANHTAYQSDMSGWCGNCHGNFHNNNADLIHPSGRAMGASIASTYGLYNGTMDQQGGDPTLSYLPQVAFEDGANTTTSTAGPSASSRVSCISCHRAHATSAIDAGRWDFQVAFLHEDGVESGSLAIPDPYNNLNQRSLCNKCHNKDEFDHNPF